MHWLTGVAGRSAAGSPGAAQALDRQGIPC
jgi:hypothetical protein